MGAAPLAEVYEKLKEIRRQGESNVEIQSIGDQLRATYADVIKLGLPETTADMIVRSLDIKTLADRVFGEEERAKAWLQRPNGSLSGQRPVDLLKDELGAAVVREMLEQIDHGIFA
jgi:putative toxin-antitoxin system antitoxin component (TIGR02293 family)